MIFFPHSNPSVRPRVPAARVLANSALAFTIAFTLPIFAPPAARADSAFDSLPEKYTFINATRKINLPQDPLAFWTYDYTNLHGQTEKVPVRLSAIDNLWMMVHYGDQPRVYSELRPGQRYRRGEDFSGVIGQFRFDGTCFNGVLQTVERLRLGETPRCPEFFWWELTRLCLTGDLLLTAEAAVQSFQLDDQCEKTTTPAPFTIPFERYVGASFMPFLPGKYIHIVAAPAVGPNPAKYKAAVKFAWDYEDLKARGQEVAAVRVSLGELSTVPRREIFQTPHLADTYELLTDVAGRHHLVLEVLNTQGQVIHKDEIIADIPRIPGVNG